MFCQILASLASNTPCFSAHLLLCCLLLIVDNRSGNDCSGFFPCTLRATHMLIPTASSQGQTSCRWANDPQRHLHPKAWNLWLLPIVTQGNEGGETTLGHHCEPRITRSLKGMWEVERKIKRRPRGNNRAKSLSEKIEGSVLVICQQRKRQARAVKVLPQS